MYENSHAFFQYEDLRKNTDDEWSRTEKVMIFSRVSFKKCIYKECESEMAPQPVPAL